MLGTSIGIKPDNTTLVIARIKKGLPAKAFTLLKKNLDTTDRELAGVLGIPISTLARRKKTSVFHLESLNGCFALHGFTIKP